MDVTVLVKTLNRNTPDDRVQTPEKYQSMQVFSSNNTKHMENGWLFIDHIGLFYLSI